jgi:hypothetical protein
MTLAKQNREGTVGRVGSTKKYGGGGQEDVEAIIVDIYQIL